MKSFARQKYGEPETRKELMLRLKEERASLERRKTLSEQVKHRNKDEFHFGFYTVGKNMVKNKKLKIEELQKALKYVNCEIKRCENKIEAGMLFYNDKHLVFGSLKKKNLIEPSNEELRNYVDELKAKRKEIVEKLNNQNIKGREK